WQACGGEELYVSIACRGGGQPLTAPQRPPRLGSTNNLPSFQVKEWLMLSLDEVKRQFVEQVKLRAYDDRYIDKNEEREILQIALQQGVTVDSARAALATVCESQGYVLESKVLSQVKDILETFAGNDGRIDEKEFNDALTICKKGMQGKKTDL